MFKAGVQHLVSGYIDPDTGALLEGGTRLVPNRFLVVRNNVDVSLVRSDDRAMLYSFDAKGRPKKGTQSQLGRALELDLVPAGLAKLTYFAFDQEWQGQLLAGVRGAGFTQSTKTVPITFTRKNLHVRELEVDVVSKYFVEGKTFHGQLVPRIRMFSVLLPKRVLAAAPPAQLDAHASSADGKRKLKLQLKLATGLITIPAGSKNEEVAVYSVDGATLPDGPYVVSLPKGALKPSLRVRGPVVRRRFDVAFAVSNLFGDFDFHLFDLPSLEAAVLAHYPERYEHILVGAADATSSAIPAGTFKAAEPVIARAAMAAAVFNQKQKLVLGAINFDYGEPIPEKPGEAHGLFQGKTILEKVIDASLESVEAASKDAELKNIATTAVTFKAAYKAFKDTRSSLKSVQAKLRIRREMAKTLDLVEWMVDGNLFQRFKGREVWKNFVIDAIKTAQETPTKGSALANYVMFFKEKSDPEVLQLFIKDGLLESRSSFEKMLSGPAKALWALDTALTLHNAIETWKSLWESKLNEQISDERLRRSCWDYHERSGDAPCVPAIARLVALRKLADADAIAADEAQMKALKEAISLSLQALSVVPVAGEFAMLGKFVMDLGGTVVDVVDQLSKFVDQLGLRHRSRRARLQDLAREHAAQVDALIAYKAQDEANDPYVQLRMRTIILAGLMRLIERCGSRLPDEAPFREKLKQYNVHGYVETFVLSANGHIPLHPGLPLDELWLYAQGNKKTEWKDHPFGKGPNRRWYEQVSSGISTEDRAFSFHRFFPVNGLDATDVDQFARAFSLDFSGVADKQLVFHRIYVRESADSPWVPVEQATFNILPTTPVRVCAVFESAHDLTGIPISLQVSREELLFFKSDGPVYKSVLAPVAPSTSRTAEDKGLLPNQEEWRFVKDRQRYYSAVFHPFYYFKNALFRGLKPIGHLGLSTDIYADYVFHLKVGDDEKKLRASASSDSVRVRFPNRYNLISQMISDRAFLENRSSQPSFSRLFNDVGGGQFTGVAGVFARWNTGTNWWYFPRTSASPDARAVVPLAEKGDRAWKWGSQLELLIVIYAQATAHSMWPGKHTLRFPAFLTTTLDVKNWLDAEGPTYPLEFFALLKGMRHRNLPSAKLQQALSSPDILGESWSGNLEAAQVRPPIYDAEMFVAKVSFRYQMEINDGELKEIAGFRPFARSREGAIAGPLSFTLNLHTPDPIGLSITNQIELQLPAMPQVPFSGTPYSGRWDLVTEDTSRKLLLLDLADLKR